MASTVDICNQALVKVGSSRIVSLDEDSTAAGIMKSIFDIKREAELAAHPWVFAMSRVSLPALSAAPLYGWKAAFPKPADFLRMVEVGEHYVLYQPDILLFELEGKSILCDESSPLNIRYVQNVTNCALFTALFVEVLACRLAMEAAEALTQSLSKRQAAGEAYKQALREARRVNAIQLPPQPTPEDTWLLARRQVRG